MKEKEHNPMGKAAMDKGSKTKANAQTKIDGIGTTTDTITGRGGLAFFVRYLTAIGIFPRLKRMFGSLRKSSKGRAIEEIFKQIFCFFADGTCRHLTRFDQVKEDPGYAAAIESTAGQMLSSHAIKRFAGAFSWPLIFSFRRLLQKLFIWRLQLGQPDVIHIGIDTMVMDNDDALKRHGVKPTYKKVKGFQPLQITWRGYIIDAVFRGGNRHSNYADHVEKAVRHLVRQIRKHYREDVPIIFQLDGGFFDQKLFAVFDELGVGHTTSGKLYKTLTGPLSEWPEECWTPYTNGSECWEYLEFGDRRGTWDKFYRVVYCRKTREDDGQGVFSFARPDTVMYTNLGMGGRIDEQLKAIGKESLCEAPAIIAGHHQRGAEELAHRALKDFADQRLPFKSFQKNAAFYYLMILAFFLFKAFLEDAAYPAVPLNAYPQTARRLLIDIAVKVVRHGGRTILRAPVATWSRLKFDQLWRRCNSPPMFHWAA